MNFEFDFPSINHASKISFDLILKEYEELSFSSEDDYAFVLTDKIYHEKIR